MAEIDPMILELRAEVGAYQAKVASATRLVDNSLAQQERAAKRLELQMRKSSDAIGNTIKGLAATFATAFTGRELVGMLDSFTRYQNALKVAGLEGDELANVQQKLFATAQQNGVAIEAVGTLYGRAAQSSKELGASTADLLNFTNAVSASLRITGTTTQEASGALLQLGQALGSPRVQAEEFNSLIDTMRPLLVEAAKHIDGTGGSLAGLIAKLKDAKGPGLSNVELFRGITAAMADLEKKAADAALTVSSGFTTLSNALTVYFGEADKANGVSVALGTALKALADNLDVILPSLALIATAIGSKYVIAAGAAAAANVSLAAAATGSAASMGFLGASTFALQARMVGAATTTEALAFAMNGLGRTLPFLAITALAAGLGYMAIESGKARAASADLAASIDGQSAAFATVIAKQNEAAAATDNLTDEQRAAITSTANLTGEADKLASAWGRVAAQAKNAAIEQAQAAYSKATTNLLDAQGAFNAKRETAFQGAARRPFAERGLGADAPALNPRQALAAANRAVGGTEEQRLFVEAARNRAGIRAELERLRSTPLADFRSTPAATAAVSGKPSKAQPGATGPNAADVARRAAELAAQVDSEIARMEVDRLRSVADLTGAAEDRAIASLAALKADRDAFNRQMTLDRELTDAQRDGLIAARNAADAQQDRQIEIERMAGQAREQRQLETAQARLQGEVIGARGAVNDRTAAQRFMTDLKLIDIEFGERQREAERAYADAVSAGNEAAATIAKSEIARLAELRDLSEEAARLRNASPLEQLREDLSRTREQLAEDVERVEVRALGSLEDSLVDAIRGAKDLGDVFSNVADQIIADLLRIAIQQTIIKPLAELLGGGSFGGGGGLVGAIGGLFGGARAVGGPVNPNQAFLVGERGPELFVPPSMGQIVANSRLNVAQGGAGQSSPVVVRLQLSGDIEAQMVEKATGVVIEFEKAVGEQRMRNTAAFTLNQAQRPQM